MHQQQGDSILIESDSISEAKKIIFKHGQQWILTGITKVIISVPRQSPLTLELAWIVESQDIPDE